MSGVTSYETAKALSALATLDRKALAKQWTDVFGSPAPRHAQVALLRGALAWQYQITHEASGEVDQLLRRLRRQAASQSSGAVLAH